MANALVCNLCQREGKAAFATVHAEGKVGLGRGARTFDVDLCEQHAEAFAPLLAIRHKTAGPVDPDRPKRTLSRIPPERVEADLLRQIVKTKDWFRGISILPKCHVGTLHQQRGTLQKFVHTQLLERRGLGGNVTYRLTVAGRKAARRAKPDHVLKKMQPAPPPPSVTEHDALRALMKFDTPVPGRTWYAAIQPTPLKGAWIRAHKTLRGRGLVEMTGSRSSARFAITPAGRRVVTDAALGRKEKAPAAEATSAPENPQRAARRLRRRGPRQTRRRR